MNIFSHPNRTIFVGGLSKFTTVQSLCEYFHRFGTITGCRLARHKLNGISKEYGFVEFESVEQAKKTSEFLPHVIDDQEVGVTLQSHKELKQKFRLFVGRLSKQTSVETLREYFSKLRQREFTLIVQKLSPNTTDESLRELFSKFGELTQSDVKFDRLTGQSRGFGYVTFSSHKELDSAIEVNPHIIDGVKVELDYVTNEFNMIVTNLTMNITEKALKDYFSRYGDLRRCETLESLPGVSTGFLGFWSKKEVSQALVERPHIINAKMVSTFQKDHSFIIYICNLPFDATDDSLFETFSKYGKLVHWDVKRDCNTNRSLGYGYVSFQNLNSAPHCVENKAVNVRLAASRQREFTLIVKKLSPNTTSESLRELFSKFRELTQSDVKFDCQTGQSRGFGYVTFSSQKQLDSAIEVNPHIIDGVKVELDYVTNEFNMIVTNLTMNIIEKALNDYFSRYGDLRRCEILESLPGVSTGFVGFWSKKEVLKVLDDRPHIIQSKRVHSFQKDQDFAVYIGSLPFDATDDSLFDTFSKYGKLVRWDVKRDCNTNHSLGYGYVSFEKAEQAVQAVKDGPHFLNGKTLKVDSNKRQTLSRYSIK